MSKVIIITGASSGMGKDAALRLVKEGHIVYGAARRINQMQDIVQAGGYAVQLDVTDTSSIQNAVEQVISEQGRIDVLWNNAGYAVAGAVEDVSAADAKHQFEVNLFGVSEMTKAVLPHMRSKKSGTIINTSSVGGKVYFPLNSWYVASKHALEGWSDCLRLELKPFNIDVVILEPGGVSTEFSDVLYEPLLERSKGGPYADVSRKLAETSLSAMEDPRRSAPPSVISDTIVKIVNSKRPKTRYVSGAMARQMLWARSILSDRLLDRMMAGFTG